MKRIEWLSKKPDPQEGHYLIKSDSCPSLFAWPVTWWMGTDPHEALRACQAATLKGDSIAIYHEVEGKWTALDCGKI
jgi:hypothetical protein